MKFLHLSTSNFFEKRSTRFIFDIDIEDEIIPYAAAHKYEGKDAFTYNLAALNKFPEIITEIREAFESAGFNFPPVGGFLGDSTTLSLDKIRENAEANAKVIEAALNKLAEAVNISDKKEDSN